MNIQIETEALVELGTASAETRGFPIPQQDIVGEGLPTMGLSDDD
jgi:hypothetical protein